MARKDADFILEALDAGEVSLVPKAANKRKFLLMKMEDPSEVTEEMSAQFDEEIMKAELEEALATPLEDEEAIMKELLEKGTLSPQALQAVRGMVRLSRGLEGELPGNFMDMWRGMMGATPAAAAAGKQAGKAPGRDKELDRYTKTKSQKEDEEMAEEVTKDAVTEEDPQAAAASAKSEEQEEVIKAKHEKARDEDDEEEENDKKKKLPAFLRKKKDKDKAEKSADGDLDLDSLPDDVRAKVQGVFKAQEDLAAQNAEMAERNAVILKEQKETQAELTEERDARATERAIQKAAVDYPNLPVKADELGPIVKLATENFSEKQVETFERVLKAADNAIAESKAFEQSKETTFQLGGNADSALGQLKAIAKEKIEKSEEGMTEAKAFAQAADDNPGLYEQYLTETRG